MGFRSRIYKLAFPFVIFAVRVFRPYLRGVRVIARHGNDILLVRHTYGSHAWGIPGGRMGRREDPIDAGIRETREETGIEITDAKLVEGNPYPLAHNMRGELWVVTGDARSRDFVTDGAEIEEICWFPKDELPEEMLKEAIVALEAAGLHPPKREG
jgi:8-oxo-dGTP pyrophosphatase MutT (NUDIX family)